MVCLWAGRWWNRAGTIFWSQRRLGRYWCLDRRWRILRRWRRALWRRERRSKWRTRRMWAGRGSSICATRSAGNKWGMRRGSWWRAAAARRSARWRKLRSVLRARREGIDEFAGGAADFAVAAVGGLWGDGARARGALCAGVVRGEAVEGRGDQRREFDGGRNGQDADGDLAGGEIFGAGEARGDTEPGVSRGKWDER